MKKKQLKHQLEEFFFYNAISRGEEYFYQNLVREVQVKNSQAFAWVQGTTKYKVSLDWQNANLGEVKAHCTCPYYDGGYFCKHLWAFILALDHRPDVLIDLPEDFSLEFTSESSAISESLTPPISSTPAQTPAPLSLNTWRNVFKETALYREPKRRNSNPDIFIVINLNTQNKGSIELQFFSSENSGANTVLTTRPLTIPRNGDLRWANPKMRAAIRAVVLMALGESSSSGYYSYGFYAGTHIISMQPNSLKIILRELLETSRVYASEEDYRKSISANTDLSLNYAKFSNLRFLVTEHTEGHVLTGRVEKRGPGLPDSNANLSEAMTFSQDLIVHHRSIGFIELTEPEQAWFKELTEEGPLLVPKGDEQPFLEAILNQQLPFELPDSLRWTEERIHPTPRIELTSERTEERGRYLVELKFEYGTRCISRGATQTKLPCDENKKVYVRDLTEESRIESLLPLTLMTFRQSDQAYFLRAQNLVEFAKNLITQGISVTVENKKIESENAVNISVSSGVDWFDVDGQASFAGKWVKFPVILEAIFKGERFVPLPDGSLGMLTEGMSKRLERMAMFAQKNDNRFRFSSAQGLLLNSLLEDEINVDLDAKFSALRKKIKLFAGVAASDPSPSFKGKLRKYQREGLGWMEFLETFGFGGILADDMGLGKTIQCLAFLEKRRAKNKKRNTNLLIAPKSLLENWKSEAAKFTPSLKVLIYAGTDRHSLEASRLKDFDLVVTTYQTMLRDFETLKDCNWDCLVCDEAQAIKNPEALISKAIKAIPSNFRLAMTGTPIENSIQDLFSISDFVNPGFLNGKKRSAGLKVSDETREVLSKAFKPVVLRRTKNQVLKDLPEKVEQTIYVELDPKQQKIYNDLKRFYQSQLLKEVEEKGLKKSQIQILAALTRLRQVALHPGIINLDYAKVKSSKFEVALEMLEEVIAEDHRVLVFSQFTSVLSLFKNELNARKIEFSYLDGQTTRRQEAVDAFKKSDAPVFLISLKAGGVGLNLVEADYVFLLDPWWNPAVEAQAIDRVHRIGQKKSVNAYRFIAKNTVEEKILELQKTKKGLSSDILGQKSGPLKSLTAEDIEHIFS